jgi:hypothetical protein
MPVTGINAVEVHFHDEFNTNTALLLQQKGSKLRDTVTVGMHKGEGAAFLEQFGEVAAAPVVTRHGATPLTDASTDRRWVFHQPYNIAIPLDREDKVNMLIDPTNKYSEMIVAGLGRSIDSVLIAGMGGTAKTGKDGSTNVSFLAGHQILNGSVGLTVDKLRQAMFLLEEANVDLDMEPAWFVGTAKMKQQLLESTEVTSADYNTVRALVNGQIDTFMGFKFRWLSAGSNPGLVGSSEHFAYAYVPSAVHLGVWQDLQTRIDERADLNYLVQVYGSIDIGATRTEEKKIVQIAASV